MMLDWLRPAAVQQSHDLVCVFAHNAQQFTCTVCPYKTSTYADLRLHRRRQHRTWTFQDRFYCDCECHIPFASRLAAANHARSCRTVAAATARPPTPTAITRLQRLRAPSNTEEETETKDADNKETETKDDDKEAEPKDDDGSHDGDTARHEDEQDQPRIDDEAGAVRPPAPNPSTAPCVESTGQASAPPVPTQATPPQPEPILAPHSARPAPCTAVDAIPPPDQWMLLADDPDDERVVESRGAKKRRVVPRSAHGSGIEQLVTLLDGESSSDTGNDSDNSSNAWLEAMDTSGPTSAPDPRPQDTPLRVIATSQPPPDAPTWTLQFAGDHARARRHASYAAVIRDTNDVIYWQYSTAKKSGRSTRTSAAYAGLRTGLLAALHHQCSHITIESTEALILGQLEGSIQTHNPRLQELQAKIIELLKRFQHWTVQHVDEETNDQALKLASRALRGRSQPPDCRAHPADADNCYPSPTSAPVQSTQPSSSDQKTDDQQGVAMSDSSDAEDRTEARAAQAAATSRDGGRVYPSMAIGASTATSPTRQPRLTLRQLTKEENEEAGRLVSRLAEGLAAKIKDSTSWENGVGYVEAIPAELRRVLDPFRPADTTCSSLPTHNDSLQHRFNEAKIDLEDIQQIRDPARTYRAVQKARRRVSRAKLALQRRALRRRFRFQEKRCVQSVLKRATEPDEDAQAPPDRCPLTASILATYFEETSGEGRPFDFASTDGEPFRTALGQLPAAKDFDILTAPIDEGEIHAQLKRVNAQASPGLDGVPHAIYKRFENELLPLLAEAFAFCQRHRKVPGTWKMGATRLIYKRGDPERAANWRPICLQACIYKLYSGILADRFAKWMDRNERFTTAQKGFRHFNGTHEHNFVASSIMDQAKRMHRQLFAVWYDLANAFGSISQQLLWEILRALGVPAEFISIVQDIYHESSFVVLDPADAASTKPIRQQRGVYQGCPLSPYLFLAAIEPLLQALRAASDVGVKLSSETCLNATAFADDIKVFSTTATGIERIHELVTRFLRWTSLRANPKKCAFLPVVHTKRGHAAAAKMQLLIEDVAIPTIPLDDGYKYLGVADSFDPGPKMTQLTELLTSVKRDLAALCRSPLAPSQVVKSIKVYLYPRLEYCLRHLRPPQSQLRGFDRALTKHLRQLLRLPKSSTSALFFAPTSQGGLGLIRLLDCHRVLQVAHGWQMLHSQDDQVRDIALGQLKQVIDKHYHLDRQHWKDHDEELVQTFLNGHLGQSPFAHARRTVNDIGSLWVDMQRQLHHLGLKLETCETTAGGLEHIQLRMPHDDKPVAYNTVLRQLKLHVKLKEVEAWTKMKSQGLTVRAHGGKGSAFITAGHLLRDDEFRFALQARLDVCNTRAALKRQHQRGNATCRNPPCSHPETLPHVLTHCPGNEDAIRARHDSALDQIVNCITKSDTKAKRSRRICTNQTVPGFTGPALRPDIQIYDDTLKTAIISDLAVTVERQPKNDRATSTLQCARDLKLLKYSCVKTQLEAAGWSVRLSALTYGALGSTTSGNFNVLTQDFKLRKREAATLDRVMSVHMIRGSHRIWRQHLAARRPGTRPWNATSQSTA